MMKQKHLGGVSVAAAVIFLCAPALNARNRKGDKYLKEAQAAEVNGDWDTALDYYQKAVNESPSDPSYLIGMRRARFEDGQMHVNRGQKLRSEGKVQEAYQEFQKALLADPSSDIAIQELKRTQQMLEGAKSAAQTGLTPVQQVRQEQLERIDSMLGPPVLKPVIPRVPTLKMNNQPPRILYETVGKLAGVNVVFDSQYSPPARGFNVDLSNSTVEQAFDYLGILTHTFWKPISSNTIFVTEDNVTKRRDYADEVVKVFYITNATTPQEFQEIATAVRTVCNIRQVFTYNAQKAMVVRGTVDEVALAEKVIHDLDKPKAEVVVDIIEMEVNSARTRDLAATLVSAGTAGLNVPIKFAPRSSIAIGGGSTTDSSGNTTAAVPVIPLSNLGRVSTADFATTLPGALLQAMLMDNRTKVISSPQVRASDGMKVTLQIGDRYPYATGSFQPGIGAVGGGVSPLVSTQFQFVDTGITVEMTPQVHSSTEVSLHVEVTISAVKQVVNLGGLAQPVIGQRKSIADIRLHDGEVNILGGLNQTQDSSAVNGIPGLVDIPVLGKILFGSDHTENDRQEFLIAMIPHIVSTPDYTPENLRGIYAGQDQVVRVNYAPTPAEAAPAAPKPEPSKPAPVTPAPAQPEAAVPGAPVPPAAPVAQARLSFQPGVVQVSPNAPFTLTIQMDNATDASSVTPLRIKFDPALVRLNDATAGDLLGRVATVKDIRNDTGEATLTLTRPPGAAGVSGSGALATLSFTAVGKGAGTVSITQANVKNSQLETLPVSLASVPVRVQ